MSLKKILVKARFSWKGNSNIGEGFWGSEIASCGAECAIEVATQGPWDVHALWASARPAWKPSAFSFSRAKEISSRSPRCQEAVAMPRTRTFQAVCSSDPPQNRCTSRGSCLPRASSLGSRCVPGEVILRMASETPTSSLVLRCASSDHAYPKSIYNSAKRSRPL